MKRIIGFFITLVISTVAFTIFAQNEQDGQNDQNALRSVVERNAYGDNWFISLGGDANLLGGEQDGDISASKRIKFGGAFNVGKWFNPYFGAQIQVMGGALRGFNYARPRGGYYVWTNYTHSIYPLAGNPFADAPAPGEEAWNDKYTKVIGKGGEPGFWQDFNYGTATLDLMANFTNLFRGHYQPHNKVDVIPFAGLGVIHAFPNHVTTPNFFHFVGKVGFRVNFNLSEKFSIYLEPQANITDKEFDGYVGTSSADGVVNLGLGIQYTFSKKYTTLSEIAQLTADEIDRLNKKINANRYLIDNHQDILERQQDLLDKLQKCCDDKPKQQVVTQVVQEAGCLPEYVRFSLDSYKIESTEQNKIADVADYLKKNPNSKIFIVGYADRKTGNPSYNLKLSQKRVEAVAAELKRLGINGNRIVSEWKGDKEQPFPPNEWNRVVVMVERK